MPLTIHLGIRSAELDAFIAQTTRLLPEPLQLICLDDPWGPDLSPEEVGTASGGDALHIQIETMTPMVILNLLVSRFETFLVPMDDGTRLVVSDTHDTRALYQELTYPDPN